MTVESIIKKALKRFKEIFPEVEEKRIEKELIPLQQGEELQPRVLKKKKSE